MGRFLDRLIGSHTFEPAAHVTISHMENLENSIGSHTPEPVRTLENQHQTEWLTVDEAVPLCSERGLSRTPKTLRKWAERSFQKEDAEIIVRREDTMWAYRWKFEKTSLLRKIEQEVSLAGANSTEPVRTSATAGETSSVQKNDVSPSVEQVNATEPVRTSAEMFAKNQNDKSDEPNANLSEPVRTRLHKNAETASVLEEVRVRLRDKDKEIEFLRSQLEKAQAEVERRATSTDEALKTIDRVVHSFELQAEANRALALRDAGASAPPNATEPIRFTPESIDPDRSVSDRSSDADYQQPSTFVG